MTKDNIKQLPKYIIRNIYYECPQFRDIIDKCNIFDDTEVLKLVGKIVKFDNGKKLLVTEIDPKPNLSWDVIKGHYLNYTDKELYVDFNISEEIIDKYVKYEVLDQGQSLTYITYNKETKYLVGTIDEAPEYYRYWED